MQNIKRSVLMLGTGLLLAGCSFVKLTPGGENVAVLQNSEVTRCERTGNTTVSVVDKVIVNRSPQAVATELRNLARNHAAQLGGDTIVPTSDINNGMQSYNIYRCRI